MSQLGPGMPGPPRVPPQNDLYTVLLIVSAVLLLIGTIVLAVQSSTLFGSVFPPSGG